MHLVKTFDCFVHRHARCCSALQYWPVAIGSSHKVHQWFTTFHTAMLRWTLRKHSHSLLARDAQFCQATSAPTGVVLYHFIAISTMVECPVLRKVHCMFSGSPWNTKGRLACNHFGYSFAELEAQHASLLTLICKDESLSNAGLVMIGDDRKASN